MRLIISIIASILFHVVAGWPWSIGGGIVAGWLRPQGGWWRGAVAVGMGWTLLIAYNLLVAYAPVSEMHRVLADIFGGLPSWTIPMLSVLTGTLLGLVGGFVGSSVSRMFKTNTVSAAQMTN